MALTNYTDLQTELDAWLHRSDLTARLPDFIKMGESFLNSRLRTVDMETRATITTGTTSRFLALPTGFVEMVSLLMQDPAKELLYMTPRILREYVTNETDTGELEYFTIKDEIEFHCIPQSAYVLEQHYYKKYDLATDATNWLMTNYPELYLNASLAVAAAFVRDAELLAIAGGGRDQTLAQLNRAEARKRGTGMAYLRADSALTQRGNTSILFS